MKKQNILISVLSIACLVGCTDKSGNESGDKGNDGELGNNVFAIENFGTAKFEAERFDVSNWNVASGDKIISNENASGGKYLAAGRPGSKAEFSFTLKAYSTVTFSAAFAQKEGELDEEIVLNDAVAFHVAAVNDFRLDNSKKLATRDSATNFELVTYGDENLYEGTYNVTVEIKSDAEYVPSIDYIQFVTSDATQFIPKDPSTITSVPDNDMRNLQQFKFVNDPNPADTYKSYAANNNKEDLSSPEGIKLRFEDVEDATKYYVQVATSEADLANAPVREATEKVYKFQNAYLATKYYYRAATSEEGLANATIKSIITTSQAPRVVYVPDVLNFRDIGGWDSDLVENGKIKQGMYFRCAQLDRGAGGNTTSKLDDAGLGKAALKELGIKVDIDMRDKNNFPSNNISAANTNDWPVAFVPAAVPSGSENVRWEGGTYQGTNIADQYKTIFNTLAKCDTDPVMLHCTYGADRTGITTFFLEALLGMSKEDMTRDYLWTQFTQGRNVKIKESDGAEFPQWIKKTDACEGETFADKMENHLISFGIEKSTLEHIREIFVPGYVAKA